MNTINNVKSQISNRIRSANSSADPVSQKIQTYTKWGIILTVVGAVLFVGFEPGLTWVLQTQLQLKEGGIYYSTWKKVPLTVSIKVRIWNIENPDEFANGAKAIVREVGPYAYK